MPSPRCRVCGGAIDGILDTCGECLAMPARPWDHAVSVYHYEGLIRELIHRFKYNRGTWLAPAFAASMAEHCRLHGGSVADCVTAVPLHWLRYLHRGYNQAELMARLVAAALGLEYRPLLVRARRTRQQALLDSASRNQNMAGVFRAKGRKNIIGSRILLVDDVMTTGSTLTAAAAELKTAGAANVEILTLARG
jgi:ComF family protein